jgi:hypothetical protein
MFLAGGNKKEEQDVGLLVVSLPESSLHILDLSHLNPQFRTDSGLGESSNGLAHGCERH